MNKGIKQVFGRSFFDVKIHDGIGLYVIYTNDKWRTEMRKIFCGIW